MSPARLASVASALPIARIGQQDMWDGYFGQAYDHDPRAERIWRAAGVRTRHAVIDPRVEDVSSWSTGARMRRFLQEAVPLGKDAVSAALAGAGVDAADVGLLAVVSCTGYVTPGLDIVLARDLGMADSLQRLVIGHMGCYAALPGLGAVADFVTARGRPAVLLCCELTSLHLQPPGESPAARRLRPEDVQQVVSHALFADAAAAVLLLPGGAAPPAPGTGPVSQPGSGPVSPLGSGPVSQPGSGPGSPLGSGPATPPDTGPGSLPGIGLDVVEVVARTDVATSDHMTWDVTDLGFRMGLSPRVPDVLAQHVRPVVDDLLAGHGLRIGDVAGWAVHPGGPRILDVVADRLELGPASLAASREVLRDRGNCSSATVLLVLQRLLQTQPLPPGAPVVMLAFGPGLSLYAALLTAGAAADVSGARAVMGA